MTMETVALTSAILSTGVGMASTIASSRAQAKAAEQQAGIARENQRLAEEQASAERRQGYENMIAQRQETARLIGRQRAISGASGAAVDTGSLLDVQEDTAARGEMDAINMYNQGLDAAYRNTLEAWNHGEQASGLMAQAKATRTNGMLSATGQLFGGMSKVGSIYLENKAHKKTEKKTLKKMPKIYEI